MQSTRFLGSAGGLERESKGLEVGAQQEEDLPPCVVAA